MRQKLIFFVIGIIAIFAIFPSSTLAQAKGGQRCYSEVDVVVANECGSSFALFSPSIVDGLALKDKQCSDKLIKLCTGPMIIAGQYVKDSLNPSPGFFVCTKIVTIGQDSLIITKDDLKTIGAGKTVKRTFRSYSNRMIVINGGRNNGKTISPYTSGKRLSVNNGWNVMTLQSQDEEGKLTEVILLFVVGDEDTPLVIEDWIVPQSPSNSYGMSIGPWRKEEAKKQPVKQPAKK